MPAFLIYEGKVAVALLVFYLFYRFLLRKETFHRFNRVVLVGTAVLSFLLPLCIITIHRPMEVAQVQQPVPMEMDRGVVQELAPVAVAAEPWWPLALAILFWAGVAFVLLRVLISILSILRIVRQGEQVREEDGCRIIVTKRNIDPFSWMRYIVLSRQDWETPHESILAHEKAHIAYGHSAEVLLVDILSAFQWFNPAIWLLRSNLKELHEYEADDAVLRSGTNIKKYQYLLIRKAVSKSGYSVANSFNHSILKNRITMMSKSKSPLSRGLRVLYLLPLVCLGIGLQARTVYDPIGKGNEKNAADENLHLSGTIWKGEQGQLSFSETTFDIRYSDQVISGDYTNEGNVIKLVFKDFKNEKTGKEKHGNDEIAGTIDGNTLIIRHDGVNMVFSREPLPGALPAVVVVGYADEAPVRHQKSLETDALPTVNNPEVDTAPVCSENFGMWLNERLLYPNEARTADGTVLVQFTVGVDGQVKDIGVLWNVSEQLDGIVARQIAKSPVWKPALKDGKPVEVKLLQPVTFTVRTNQQ